MVRVNITLDEELYKELSSIKNKSEFIRAAVREKLRIIKEENLKKVLKEGYKGEGKNLKEWESTVADAWD
ncbi:MAG TPA: ribbon-helix-helix domain-containing protein [Thermodesulfobacteriota bacterium]|nr:ribbon-helix-helix domain-containing protein [Thermodesulfobacteriota bacterium]